MRFWFQTDKTGDRSRVEKLTLAGLFVAAAILLSGVHFPMGPTRCYPFQHTVNVLAGAFLGPWWLRVAFTSIIRNMTAWDAVRVPDILARSRFGFRVFSRPKAAEPPAPVLLSCAGAHCPAWKSLSAFLRRLHFYQQHTRASEWVFFTSSEGAFSRVLRGR